MSVAQAVQRVVDELAAAWNSRDWIAFGRLFAEDADYISGSGVRLAGRGRIQSTFTDSKADTAASDQVVLVTESIKAIGPDAAVVLCAWRMGPDAAGRAGLLTIVTRRADEGWRIIALHNTDTTAETEEPT